MANLEKLVDQVRAVTTAQERIKTEIAGAALLEQNLWNLKRETYIRLFESYGDAYAQANEAANVYMVAEKKDAAGQQISEIEHKRAVQLGDAMRDTQRRISQNVAIAGMVVSGESTRILQAGLNRWTSPDSLVSAADFVGLREDIDTLVSQLQGSAQADLKHNQPVRLTMD